MFLLLNRVLLDNPLTIFVHPKPGLIKEVDTENTP